ncbi:flagellar motor protein MotD [Pseudomarimonas salicorniae]|uniref:Flagellar motor protein MotD n=1 Tax=Pseudomarimonas salicorniae TaxID=2933270 RepID=A0ABT0GKR9_9GAMM|nr:flagellar motor protein MotD [Lysobacter sp. CAU 1642]MCK7595129.1 flagellar motor protein MotD [Lysobacter sp. CAU 1642]
MSRRRAHEDHANHEAWAIPYGDLITLLLAFFVVMYAISSVNEGKYRVLSYSLNAAFGGPPKTLNPIQVGTQMSGSDADRSPPIVIRGAQGLVAPIPASRLPNLPRVSRQIRNNLPDPMLAADRAEVMRARDQLNTIGDDIERTLGGLIERDLIAVNRTDLWIEVAIKSDILFASGSALPNEQALRVLNPLADALLEVPNSVRIEGHTDNVPIATAQFPSNWELSGARAASVLRVFAARGIDPSRLSLLGYGDMRPIAGNDTAEGRRANRRVVVVILADMAEPDAMADPAEGAPSTMVAPIDDSTEP